jgi:hypothetical protein
MDEPPKEKFVAPKKNTFPREVTPLLKKTKNHSKEGERPSRCALPCVAASPRRLDFALFFCCQVVEMKV